MLHGLGRWLRAAGYDTALVAPGLDDGAMLDQAAAEGRLLLTRDRRLSERRAATSVELVQLAAERLDAMAVELARRLGIDWLRAPFRRCLMDNTPLLPAEPTDRARIPPPAQAAGDALMRCPHCGRIYWPGSHVRRMRARLARWREAAASE